MSTVNDYINTLSSFDVNDQSVIDLITLMEKEIGTEYPTTDLRNKAVALLTMHWLSLTKNSSGNYNQVGSVQQEKEGDLSRKYGFHGKVDFSDSFLSQTPYGIALMSLNKSCFFKPKTRAFNWLQT